MSTLLDQDVRLGWFVDIRRLLVQLLDVLVACPLLLEDSSVGTAKIRRTNDK